jgi:hypothetical protein
MLRGQTMPTQIRWHGTPFLLSIDELRSRHHPTQRSLAMPKRIILVTLLTLYSVVSAPTRALAQERNTSSAGKPLVTLYGENSKVTDPKFVRITSEEQWTSTWFQIQLGAPGQPQSNNARMQIDFDKTMVIAVFGGNATMCAGYDVDSLAEDHKRITLRVQKLHYQISPAADYKDIEHCFRCQPWGFFVLPRSDKEIVLERDDRGRLDMPHKWVKWKTLPAISRQ